MLKRIKPIKSISYILLMVSFSLPLINPISLLAQEQEKQAQTAKEKTRKQKKERQETEDNKKSKKSNKEDNSSQPNKSSSKNDDDTKSTKTESKSDKSEEKSDYDKTILPPNEGKPIPVAVGVYIINFAGIDEPKENYQIVGYLTAKWQDKRLAFNAKKLGLSEKVYNDKDQVWHPDLEIFNQVGARNSSRIQIKITPSGNVSYIESFDATVSSDLQLRRFPFDSQSLRLIIDSFQYHNKEVLFLPDKDKIGVNREPFVTLSEWTIKDVKYAQTDQFFPQDKKTYSRLNIFFDIQRNSGFYVWKIFLPLLLIFGISWACFWISLELLDILTAIGVTNLLTGIAFSLTVTGSLPKVSYLTFIDGFIGLIYLFIFAAIIEVILLHYLSNKNEKSKETAELIHDKGRLVFPVAFLVGNLVLVLFIML